MVTTSATNYIIVTQSAFGQVFLRKSPMYAVRFVVEKTEATKFHSMVVAAEWLVEQKKTLNEQMYERCKIIEEF